MMNFSMISYNKLFSSTSMRNEPKRSLISLWKGAKDVFHDTGQDGSDRVILPREGNLYNTI
jgi:hypothetical protein